MQARPCYARPRETTPAARADCEDTPAPPMPPPRCPHRPRLGQVWLFDARTFSSEPAARLRLPVRVPHGFHGLWVTEEQLQVCPCPRAAPSRVPALWQLVAARSDSAHGAGAP